MDFRKIIRQGTEYEAKDKTAREALQNIYTKDEVDALLKKIPTDVARTANDATFVNITGGTRQSLFYLRQATASLAGLMTSESFVKLRDLPEYSVLEQSLSEIRSSIMSLDERVRALEQR